MGDEIRISVIATGIEQVPAAETEKTYTSGRVTPFPKPQATPAVQPAETHAPVLNPLRRAPIAELSDADLDTPTVLRRQQPAQQALHAPGQQDTFTFGSDDDYELPSCFRTQAN